MKSVNLGVYKILGDLAMAMENIGKMGGRIRVAIVDHENIRLRLKGILQSRESLIFAGGFSSGKEALTGTSYLRPDLVALDVGIGADENATVPASSFL